MPEAFDNDPFKRKVFVCEEDEDGRTYFETEGKRVYLDDIPEAQSIEIVNQLQPFNPEQTQFAQRTIKNILSRILHLPENEATEIEMLMNKYQPEYLHVDEIEFKTKGCYTGDNSMFIPDGYYENSELTKSLGLEHLPEYCTKDQIWHTLTFHELGHLVLTYLRVYKTGKKDKVRKERYDEYLSTFSELSLLKVIDETSFTYSAARYLSYLKICSQESFADFIKLGKTFDDCRRLFISQFSIPEESMSRIDSIVDLAVDSCDDEQKEQMRTHFFYGIQLLEVLLALDKKENLTDFLLTT